MPKYSPNGDEMDEAYGPRTRVTPPSDRSEKSESVDDENAGAEEILIEKSKLPPGCKVGDTYTFRVTQDFGDEAALELVSKEKGETEYEEPESVEAGELAALSEEGEA